MGVYVQKLKQDCTACTACVLSCPTGSIRMEDNMEGFAYPVIDGAKCIQCSVCEDVCPVGNQYHLSDTLQSKALAALNKDSDIRKSSSSGGVFAELANWILEKDGITVGAAYDEEYRVSHILIREKEDIVKCQGAKYSQSIMGDVFAKIRILLEEGRWVLFSGTPCQVVGLKNYLRKDYDRLVLVDMICHGVPSPKVWKHYLTYRKSIDAPGIGLKKVDLRSKVTGWPGYSVRIEYEDDTVYQQYAKDDPYIRGFVGNYYLRESCYHCKFKSNNRVGDFTLGDYWGVYDQMPDYHDGLGTSILLLNSEKSKAVWNEIKDCFKCQEVDPNYCFEANPSAMSPSNKPLNREEFWQGFESKDFNSLIDELLPKKKAPIQTVLSRYKAAARRLLARIGI